MARAIWKGVIVARSAKVPVRLYSAVEDRSIHFRLLHEKDLVPVKQYMVHPGTDEIVERDEMLRGHEVEPGVFVILDEEELEEAEPEDSREIEALRFVPDSAIDGRWYDRPYYLGMAEKLVETLSGHFDPVEFRGEYRDRVLDLIAKKAKGEKVELKRVRKKRAEGSLTDVLKRSIDAGKEKAVA